MTTKSPIPQRPIRESRIEAAHAENHFTEIPEAHFRVASSSVKRHTEENDYPSGVTHRRLPTHVMQIARTTLPLFFADCAGLALALSIASIVATSIFSGVASELQLAPQLFSIALLFISIFSLLGLYPGVGLNPIIELRSLAWGTVTSGAALLVMFAAYGHWTIPHIAFAVSLTALCLIFAPLTRCTVRSFLATTRWWGHPAIIIGHPESALKLLNSLKKKASFGLRPVGIITEFPQIGSSAGRSAHIIGSLTDLAELTNEYKVFWALIAPGPGHQRTNSFSTILKHCESIPNVVMVPGFEEFPSLWNRTQDLGGVLGICFRERLLDPWAQLGKRLFDIVGVLLGSFLLSPIIVPVFLLTWLCMKLKSPGPIFYGQERVGKDGRRFQAWKFRTMVLNAESALKVYLQKHPEKKLEWDLNQKLRDDPRIIPGIGNLLRKTSLDELPQLWNVLVGEMSLVGPRPFMTEQTGLYGERFGLYQKVRPGITGLWQISGRNHTTFEERGQFDAYYVRNWSFWLDIFILGRTVKTVLFREGAF